MNKRAVVVLSFILLFSIFPPQIIQASDKITFSQEVIGYDETGSPYPALDINPGNITGMKQIEFELGRGKVLVIRTNAENTDQRGLPLLAETIKKCSNFVEQQTGRKLNKDILFYIIELDYMPHYYRFEAGYSSDDEVRWGEVRLVLVEKEDLLIGPDAPQHLNELLFDTLPHELTHDVLGNITNLKHDLDGQPSVYTRWFIEGTCELLAKEFSYQEAPYLWKTVIEQRHLSSVMQVSATAMPGQIFKWSQENHHSMDIESDLYGVAFLILKGWTNTVSLKDILHQVVKSPSPLIGTELISLMQKTSGLNQKQSIERAMFIGAKLTAKD